MKRLANIALMFGQRRRRWANIKATLSQRITFAWTLCLLSRGLFGIHLGTGGIVLAGWGDRNDLYSDCLTFPEKLTTPMPYGHLPRTKPLRASFIERHQCTPPEKLRWRRGNVVRIMPALCQRDPSVWDAFFQSHISRSICHQTH